MIRQRKVRLTYTNRARVRSERLIDPWGLVDKDEIWYLIAGTEQGQRTFRVDRILEAEPTGQPAERPDDFTLASGWEQVVREVEQQRSRTWATVLIEARFVPVLRDHFGRHCHTDSQPGDGRARVRIAAPTHPARHRQEPGRVGRHDRSHRTANRAGRTGPHRRTARRSVRLAGGEGLARTAAVRYASVRTVLGATDGAGKATDGTGGSGYADRPSSSGLAFQDK